MNPKKSAGASQIPKPSSDEELHREQVADVTISLRQSPGQHDQASVESDVAGLPKRLAESLQANDALTNQLKDLRREVSVLRNQVERFNIAARGSHEGLWVAEPCSDIPWNSPECPVWYSPQFVALLGYEESEFPGVMESWAKLLHPDDREHVFESMKNHIEHQVPYFVEYRLQTKSGEYRWFQATGEATFNANGGLIRGGGTLCDITDRKLAEESIRRNHTLLNAVLEGMSDVVYAKDLKGRYLLVNSSGATLMGKTIGQIIGKTDQELFGNQQHPLFVQGDAEVLRGAGTQAFEVEKLEQQAVSRTFLVTKEPLGCSQISQGGVIGFAHDITFRKAAELTIKEREKRYRAIMENAYDLIAEVDVEGRFLYVSPNFKDILGYGSKDLLGTSIFSSVHADDREEVLAEFQQGMKTQGSGRSIYRYRHHDGEYRWFESTGRVFQTALGELRGVVISRDITQRKQLEDALEAIVKGNLIPGSPNFFETLVGELAKALKVPMAFLSERIEIGDSKARTLAFWNQDHFEPPSEYECLGGPCEHVFRGTPVAYQSEVKQLFPRSETIQELAIEAYFGVPLFNSQNEVVGNLALMDTRPVYLSSQGQYLLQIFAARAGAELERKRAQEAVQESEERYRALYNQTPLMYFTVDANLKVLSVNQFGGNLLGYGVNDLVGTSVLIVVHEEDRLLVKSALEERFHGHWEDNRTSQSEFRKVKKDGTVLWVRETVQAVMDPHQQKILLLSCEDITDRKMAEEALARSEKQFRHTQKMEAIGTLAGGIAHDFNNILGAILGYSELAMTQVSQDQRVKSYLDEVVTAGNRAKELVKQILAFSRRTDQEREAVDLEVIVKEALKMIRATLPSTIEIRSALEVAPAVVFADPTQMHQVVMNLCANAEYAMRKEGGILDLSLTSVELTANSVLQFPSLKPGRYLRLTIRDSGQGISSQVLERIFEPFFTTKGSGEGTGLGLAVVHGVIVGHGGHISVSSAIGQGTTFSILLPRLDVVPSAHSSKTEEWPKGSGKVLFVDDEEMLARWGEQLLTHLGYEVVAKTNPHEAVDLFRKQADQFDLVVTDQTMPTMSGEVFARALLDIRENISIILCTGFSHIMSEEKAKQLGLSAFLMKPVNAAALAQTVKSVLNETKNPSNET